MSGNSTCKFCGEFIRWKPKQSGNGYAPINPDGSNHAITCNKSDMRRTAPQIIIAPAKFLPLLNDLKKDLDAIEERDDEAHKFVERLLLMKENNQLHQITQTQFEWLERLHEEYCT